MNYDFDVYIVNKTIRHRFIKKSNCTNEFVIISEIKLLFIQTYNRMHITIDTFTKKKLMKFLNMSYVSNFMINIVANSIFVDKKFYFDTTHDYFYKNNTFIVFVLKINAHYILKNNKNF